MELTSAQNSPDALSNRLGVSALPVGQVLRQALHLAAALRSVHEQGQICGVLDPARIYFNANEAVIEPAATDFSPYVAPELFEGARPDVRSDIFAFGGIVYHMLTGRQPFPGSTAAEIRQSMLAQPVPALGALTDGQDPVAPDQYPWLERTVLRCLESNPERRWQRAQSVCMELKLLSIAANRADPSIQARRVRAEAQLREQIAQHDRAMDARFTACERSVAEAVAAFQEIRDQVKLALGRVEETILAHSHSLEALHANTGRTEDVLERVVESLGACDQSLVELHAHSVETRDRVKSGLESLEERVAGHAHAIEALQAASNRSDDVLERVVESFDCLQSFVLERTADATVAAGPSLA
jgi:hypothetical protein